MVIKNIKYWQISSLICNSDNKVAIRKSHNAVFCPNTHTKQKTLRCVTNQEARKLREENSRAKTLEMRGHKTEEKCRQSRVTRRTHAQTLTKPSAGLFIGQNVKVITNTGKCRHTLIPAAKEKRGKEKQSTFWNFKNPKIFKNSKHILYSITSDLSLDVPLEVYYIWSLTLFFLILQGISKNASFEGHKQEELRFKIG